MNNNTYYRVRAYIHKDALDHNMKEVRRLIKDQADILAVIKSNAYGHGIENVLETLFENHVRHFAVASPMEAQVVRSYLDEHGEQGSILILGYTDPSEYETALNLKLDLTVYTLEQGKALSDAAVRTGLPARVHYKIDTGMERIGFQPTEESADRIAEISRMEGIVSKGIFTHFARADEADLSFTQLQFSRFTWMLKELETREVKVSYIHCANSAAIMDFPEGYQNLGAKMLVRAGIMMYGYYPSDEMEKNCTLEPIMTLKSHVVHLKWVEAGTPIGYGGAYVTPSRTLVATVPVGYGDGYPRRSFGKAKVMIKGQAAPVIGRVCMDQMMVDVTNVEGVELLDEVILFGKELPLENLAEAAGTIHYEILCQLTDRVERVVE